MFFESIQYLVLTLLQSELICILRIVTENLGRTIEVSQCIVIYIKVIINVERFRRKIVVRTERIYIRIHKEFLDKHRKMIKTLFNTCVYKFLNYIFGKNIDSVSKDKFFIFNFCIVFSFDLDSETT